MLVALVDVSVTNGESNGNPLQYSCLENPMYGGAWWATVHGVAESEMTERLHFHFSLSCTGEENGNPLQYSCLENPRDGRAWWAAIYGVVQSRTRLKRLSSSSNPPITELVLLAARCFPGSGKHHPQMFSPNHIINLRKDIFMAL